MVKLISNVNFLQIHVLPEFGVMMALVVGKMSVHIRMYSLALLAKATQKERGFSSFPCVKLKGSKTCQHFSICRFLLFSSCPPPSFFSFSLSVAHSLTQIQRNADRTSSLLRA